MRLKIRPATRSDAEEIQKIWNPWIKDSIVTFNSIEKTVGDVAALIAERQISYGFWVAELDSDLAGFVTYAQFRQGIGYAGSMEHTIILSPKAQGKGVGRALMCRLEADAAAKSVHQMIAGVTGENKAGRDFHARIGYETVAIIPKVGYKFNRYHDLIVMQKILT